jgi:AcrR family transcriptional regulator
MEKPTGRRQARPYHHGDLKAALLEQAELILEQDGIQALTLRAAARAAGVSHAAPANHFGDLTGLLSELAAVGFNRFSARLAAATAAAGDDGRARSSAMGRAYVDFASAHPGLFALMFRGERLDDARPALKDALAGARETLRASAIPPPAGAVVTPLRTAGQAAARWSLVHGFALLLLDGRLADILCLLPEGQGEAELLSAVIEETRIGD